MTRAKVARVAWVTWRGAGFLWVLLGGALVVLGGCRFGAAEQHQALWREEQLLFVADGRNGWVRVFDLRNGMTPRAVLMAPPRHAVLDMALDSPRNRLWVLGDDALYAYDAHDLALRQRLALPGNTGPGRRLELAGDGSVHLLDAGMRRTVVAASAVLANDRGERLSFGHG